jgi:hypothetical protein
MSILSDDIETRIAFAIHENKGVFALLLGSGLSRAAEIPTGWEITLDLVRCLATAQGEPEQDEPAKWADWHRAKFGGEPNYSKLLEELTGTPEERRAVLHGYIDPSEEDRQEGRKRPTKAHLAIADMVRDGHIRVIVTTNFDRLLENALRERGVEPTVVASVDALKGAEPLTHSACYILKLHGDYKDSRILNTDEELSGYPTEYEQLLDRIFDEFGLIVAGWSGEWDHALRKAMLRAPNRRYPTFWAVRGGIGDGAKGLIDHRRAVTVDITDADSFFTRIRERVETLTQSRRRNPAGIELLISTAKRYLAKPEHRIQLDDLITQETERLLARLEGEAFAVSGRCNADIFRSQVSQYEAAVEPLARLVGVLGRWGDGSEFPLVMDILKRLHAHGEAKRYTISLPYLNMYPAILTFSAYSLGLTRAERWKELYQFFTATIAYYDQGHHIRAIDRLFLTTLEDGNGNIWKNIEGFESRHTPFSDHLADIFQDWRQSFCGLIPDFELLFERFELLGALVHLERNSAESLREVLSSDRDRNWEWMPIGRVGWDRSRNSRLIAELGTETFRTALLNAGFAKGDAELLNLSIQNFQRLSGRLYWR